MGDTNTPLTNCTPPSRVKPDVRDPLPNDDVKRIQWAKDIIAGRIPGQRMITTPRVKDFLERDPALSDKRTTQVARDRIADWLNLQDYYGGHDVACFTTTDGFRIPLAVDDDITELLNGLTEEEAAQVVIEYPPAIWGQSVQRSLPVGQGPLQQQREKRP